jgi:hypothetical protein
VLATSKSIQLRSLVLNIVSSSKDRARLLQSASPVQVHIGVLSDAAAARLLGGRRRRWGGRRRRGGRRRTAQRHPVNDRQLRRPDAAVLAMLVGVLFEVHDRRDLAVVLAPVEASRTTSISRDGLGAADGRRFVTTSAPASACRGISG